jgi:hypothetical protein
MGAGPSLGKFLKSMDDDELGELVVTVRLRLPALLVCYRPLSFCLNCASTGLQTGAAALGQNVRTGQDALPRRSDCSNRLPLGKLIGKGS